MGEEANPKKRIMSEREFMEKIAPAANRWVEFCKANGLDPTMDIEKAMALAKAHPEAYKANPPKKIKEGM